MTLKRARKMESEIHKTHFRSTCGGKGCPDGIRDTLVLKME